MLRVDSCWSLPLGACILTGAFLPRTLSLSCDVEMCLFESEEELLLLQGCVAYARDSEIALRKVCLTGHLKASKAAACKVHNRTKPVLQFECWQKHSVSACICNFESFASERRCAACIAQQHENLTMWLFSTANLLIVPGTSEAASTDRGARDDAWRHRLFFSCSFLAGTANVWRVHSELSEAAASSHASLTTKHLTYNACYLHHT